MVQAFNAAGCNLCHIQNHTTAPSVVSGLSKVTYSPFSDFEGARDRAEPIGLRAIAGVLLDGIEQIGAAAIVEEEHPLAEPHSGAVRNSLPAAWVTRQPTRSKQCRPCDGERREMVKGDWFLMGVDDFQRQSLPV
jgi:hypothetical protein